MRLSSHSVSFLYKMTQFPSPFCISWWGALEAFSLFVISIIPNENPCWQDDLLFPDDIIPLHFFFSLFNVEKGNSSSLQYFRQTPFNWESLDLSQWRIQVQFSRILNSIALSTDGCFTVAEIPKVIHLLTQSTPSVQTETIEKYFTSSASFTHPFCRTRSFEGSRWLITRIYRFYKIMSPQLDLEVKSVGTFIFPPSAIHYPRLPSMLIADYHSIRFHKPHIIRYGIPSIPHLHCPVLRSPRNPHDGPEIKPIRRTNR